MTLTTAYVCVLIAALLPYLWVAVAKASGERYDNRDPRRWQDKQQSPRSQRASAAQLNSYEAFAPFAAGVVMAQLAGVAHSQIAALALAFVVLRVLHGIAYVSGRHYLRTLIWMLAFACVLVLLVQAALHVVP
ncbi:MULTISPECIES: MAPEG family protein [unclassified Lysobacter]|uniref:MAPEG family protein n=1 Tax=unclassified Lysobacter TaxID=2635362 RepID=UPI001C21437D|nr:MAPEG family protein [Lysobacter sp. MMG2]MBU8977381.1 MAPEG family protein [Lysobacter sp. MMG2]